MNKIKYNIKQEVLDLIKKKCEHNKNTNISNLTLFNEKDIDFNLFNQSIEIDENNILFTYLSKTNQYIFEAIFYSSINYEEKGFKMQFNKFLLEIFDSNQGKTKDIILQSDYDEDEKIIIAFVCSNYSSYYNEFINFFKNAESIFIQEYEKQYDIILEKINDLHLDDIFLASTVKKASNLIICITNYKDVRFHQESNTILYGISHLLKKDNTEENHIETLKILCDATKYSILKELSIKSSYQRELANKLSLTTATIAHHISILLEKDIIHSKLIKNKVFFTINYEKIDFILQIFKSGIFKNKKA